MYLKEAWIKDYKSIKDERVQFEPGLNIFIGKNGTGKSNLLEYVKKSLDVQRLMFPFNNPLEYHIHETQLLFADNRELWEVRVKTYPAVLDFYELLQSKGSLVTIKKCFDEKWKTVAEDNSIGQLNEEAATVLNTIMRVRLVTFQLPERLALIADKLVIDPTVRGLNSDNYFSVANWLVGRLSHILQTETAITDFAYNINLVNAELDEHFGAYLRNYSNIAGLRLANEYSFQHGDNYKLGNLVLEYKVDDVWQPWTFLSDGTKRLFYLITEVVLAEGLVLIEEPELGVHPRQLFRLMTLIKEQAETKQIFVTTHSPIVLDVLSPTELDKITITTLENGKTKFKKLPAEKKQKAVKYIKEVGELSYHWIHSDSDLEEA